MLQAQDHFGQLPAHTNQVNCCAFNAVGTELDTCSADGTMRVYRIGVSHPSGTPFAEPLCEPIQGHGGKGLTLALNLTLTLTLT